MVQQSKPSAQCLSATTADSYWHFQDYFHLTSFSYLHQAFNQAIEPGNNNLLSYNSIILPFTTKYLIQYKIQRNQSNTKEYGWSHKIYLQCIFINEQKFVRTYQVTYCLPFLDNIYFNFVDENFVERPVWTHYPLLAFLRMNTLLIKSTTIMLWREFRWFMFPMFKIRDW